MGKPCTIIYNNLISDAKKLLESICARDMDESASGHDRNNEARSCQTQVLTPCGEKTVRN